MTNRYRWQLLSLSFVLLTGCTTNIDVNVDSVYYGWVSWDEESSLVQDRRVQSETARLEECKKSIRCRLVSGEPYVLTLRFQFTGDKNFQRYLRRYVGSTMYALYRCRDTSLDKGSNLSFLDIPYDERRWTSIVASEDGVGQSIAYHAGFSLVSESNFVEAFLSEGGPFCARVFSTPIRFFGDLEYVSDEIRVSVPERPENDL